MPVGCTSLPLLGCQTKDYTLIWPGVVLAVNEFAAAQGLQVHFTAEVWWMFKP